jgi:hypothetical protein
LLRQTRCQNFLEYPICGDLEEKTKKEREHGLAEEEKFARCLRPIYEDDGINLQSNIQLPSFPDDEELIMAIVNEIVNKTMRFFLPRFDFHSKEKDDLLETESEKFDLSMSALKQQ